MISICMAHYNRPNELDEGVYSIFKTYPQLDFEISICDDRSRGPLSLDRFPSGQRAHIRLSWLMGTPEPRNPCAPLNLAVNRSKGDVIVLTNPEIIHTKPVLTEMLEVLEAAGPMAYVTARCEDERGVIAGREVDYSKDGRLPVPKRAHFHFCAMLHRSLWEKAGGFDEDYRNGQACEDNDWLWRLHNAGAEFFHVDTPVWHIQTKLKWNLPHNKDLFYKKWPELR